MLKKKTCHPTRALRVLKFRDLFFNRPRFRAYGDSSDCLGRSMIEMLGVLAIIGVLSAAGLAGYSKAMSKHRVNHIIDQFAQIQHNLSVLYHRQETYRGIDNENALELAVNAGIFPEDMIFVENGSKVVRHAGKGTVTLFFNEDDVSVTFNDLSKEAAIALASANFDLNWVKIEKQTTD